MHASHLIFRTTLLASLILLGLGGLHAQDAISLEQSLAAARQTSLLAQQSRLQGQMVDIQDETLKSRWLPGLNLAGQATYQSDVVSLPENPAFSFPELPRAQYRVTLDAQQMLYDGGRIKQARALNRMGQLLQEGQTEISLYQLDQQITQLYMGVLLAQEQQKTLQSSLQYLEKRRKSLQTGIEQGVLLAGNLDAFDREILSLQQKLSQLEASEYAQRQMLAVWTGDSALANAELVLPDAPLDLLSGKRPEHQLFRLRKNQLEVQEETLQAQRLPNVLAFGTAGVGQPNPYNFLENSFDGFYLLGVKASWNPWDWGNTQRQREQLMVQREMINQQQQQFDRGIQAQLAQIDAEFKSLEFQISQDQDLIRLQQKIVRQAESQVENGTLTTPDYLSEVLSLTQAEQALSQHQVRKRLLIISRAQVVGNQVLR